MRLSRLLDEASIPAAVPETDPLITGIAYDSRRVAPGNLFVAITGFHVDGTRFVADTFQRGAVAAVVNNTVSLDAACTEADAAGRVLRVAETRPALAALAAAWYGFPARRLRTVGITGTDGKTSTSYLVLAVLEAGGWPTGLFTTVSYRIGGTWEQNDSRQTTPEALEVQQLLRRMVDAGDRCAVLESSSHGLELHKLDYCDYDVAVFTNLAPDHLDFHGTVERYREAKGRLFVMLDTSMHRGSPFDGEANAAKGFGKLAVLNADDPASAYMAAQTRAPCLTYGIENAAEVRPIRMDLKADGSELVIATPSGEVDCFLPLPGRFNVYNALAATAVGIGVGVDPGRIGAALSAINGIPGRMQRVDAGQPFSVIVDYAHTGAAFAKVLATLRPLTRGRLIAVLGCAGERGVERRSGMGAVAAHAADYTVITTEDPRSEDPAAIIDQIAAAMTAAGGVEGRTFERVPDRRKAIGRAFTLAGPGDLVLLTGKGHEHSIETADGSVPWDEVAVAHELLTSIHGDQTKAGSS